jgi:hypothetical protein
MFLILLTAREGCLCPKSGSSLNSHIGTRALRSAVGVAAAARANVKTGSLSNYKTTRNAVILFRR